MADGGWRMADRELIGPFAGNKPGFPFCQGEPPGFADCALTPCLGTAFRPGLIPANRYPLTASRFFQ